jgi:hypothetical protein
MEHGPEQEMQARGGSPTQAPEEYGVLVLGSGEPGKYIAWTFAKSQIGSRCGHHNLQDCRVWLQLQCPVTQA